MAEGRIKSTELSAIANAIRQKNGESTTYKPSEMAAAIEAIPTGGSAVIESKSITENGTYTAPTGVDGYSPVVVAVQPNLQSKTATENGTVTPDSGYDGLSSVVVNVSGGGSVNILSGTEMPTASVGSDGAIYLQIENKYEDSGLGWYAKREYVVKDTTTKLWNSWVKSNTVPSIAVRYHYSSWYGAIQISTDADGVKHTSNTGSPAGSAVVDGVTWYISKDASWNSTEGTTEVPSHNDTVRPNGSNIQAVVERILSEADMHSGVAPQSDYVIINTFLKVNGAWQALIGSDIDDVGTGGGSA